jgi:uncharacterized protein YbjT (DUF2867 family)
MILVTGAAGKTGQAVVRRLAARRLPVRALVYRADQAALYEHIDGVQTSVGALEDQAAMARAMGGVRSIYFICPNMHPDEYSLAASAIELALKSGVERFVYHSVLLPAVEEMPHHWQKHMVEQVLAGSGLDYTTLQPCAYMQNLLVQWPRIRRDHEFEVPYSLDSRMSLVDLEDVAEAAATVLSTDGHAGSTYELCGPEALSQHDLADALSEHTGSHVEARLVSATEWELGVRSELTAYAIDALLNMFEYYDQRGLRGDPAPLGRLLDRPPTSFTEFIRRTRSG